MCETCGCGSNSVAISGVIRGAAALAIRKETGAASRSATHDHVHDHGVPALEEVGERVMAKNDGAAADNRVWLVSRGVAAVNLMSSPGAGKTTLLVATLPELAASGAVGVVEGDQATSIDGDRIAATGATVVQINTGRGCHLEADMVRTALERLALPRGGLAVIENVGNLVCPALFDLGEGAKIVLLSVTEGDDKPAKYPHMFAAADLVVFTKIDLLPHVDFDVARAKAAVAGLNPRASFLELSARSGVGMRAWLAWLAERRIAQNSTSEAACTPC
ncbi:MAG: hydrogenase nickel incorporation protein HypB [Deltaproteobacteria bacterium]|nr:hydrogenase nickel incorporation protein HypB [Deltaproteobacteria bacterium]